MIFNGLTAGGLAAKGFIVEPPDFDTVTLKSRTLASPGVVSRSRRFVHFGRNEDAPSLEKPPRHLLLPLAKATAHFGGVVVRFGGDLTANGSQPFETETLIHAADMRLFG